MQTNGGNAIVSNHIGTDLAGTVDRGNRRGIWIDGVPDNRIENNLISGNDNFNSGLGIEISGIAARNNQVISNRIGTDVTGTVAIGNNAGISIRNAPENLIQDNLISGNVGIGSGILINGPTANQNRVVGNLIGTDITGNVALGNSIYGISIGSASNNIIGGTTP